MKNNVRSFRQWEREFEQLIGVHPPKFPDEIKLKDLILISSPNNIAEIGAAFDVAFGKIKHKLPPTSAPNLIHGLRLVSDVSCPDNQIRFAIELGSTEIGAGENQ